MKTTIDFNGTGLALVRHCGQSYLTLSEVARALYSKGAPQSATPFETRVRDLYRRHADEFTGSMTTVIKMQTAGGMQDVRIFSLRGCHLLGMFARTERAKEFRRWVLDVLDGSSEDSNRIKSEFQMALVEFTSERAVASICGKGLKRWQGRKQPLESNLKRLTDEIQGTLAF